MPMDIKHILLPVDFSEFSTVAFETALEIAGKTSAEITLLHVIESVYGFATEVEAMDEELEKNATKNLQSLKSIKSNSDYSSINVKTLVLKGKTVPKIVHQIRSSEPGLVIMGSKGKTGLEKIFFGSISSRVMLESPVPVLVLPEMDSVPPFKRLLFTSALREKDPEHLIWLNEFASLFKGKTTLLHVIVKPSFENEIRRNGFVDYVQNHTDLKKINLETVVNDDILDGISDFLIDNPADLLVMNRYKKSLVDSLTSKDHTRGVMNYAKLPILILPAADD
jgi:nucleotide-binding universal stress UspA family protein